MLLSKVMEHMWDCCVVPTTPLFLCPLELGSHFIAFHHSVAGSQISITFVSAHLSILFNLTLHREYGNFFSIPEDVILDAFFATCLQACHVVYSMLTHMSSNSCLFSICCSFGQFSRTIILWGVFSRNWNSFDFCWKVFCFPITCCAVFFNSVICCLQWETNRLAICF